MKRWIAVVFVWILMVGNAGAESAQTKPTKYPDACSLVSKEDLQKITGESTEPQPGAAPPATEDVTVSQCMYSFSDGAKSMSTLLRTSKKGDNEAAYARQVIIDSGMKVEDIPDLADVAFWYGVQLQVYKGKHVQYVITVMGLDDPKEKAVAVARKALEKL